MKKLFLLPITCFLFAVLQAQPIKVMLVTGGHSFDTIQFFQMFDALEGIEYEHFEQPQANQNIAEGVATNFDVLVFYDMWKTISEEEKSAYLDLAQQGKPFLFLHHSLASYQNWAEFENIIGGKYVEKQEHIDSSEWSNYKHDVWVQYEVIKKTPVTKSLKDFRLFDEIYGNVRISEQVIPLIRTNHAKSMEFIAWENKYKNSRIIYLQPGHDKNTYEDINYRKLLFQAISYLSKSNKY